MAFWNYRELVIDSFSATDDTLNARIDFLNVFFDEWSNSLNKFTHSTTMSNDQRWNAVEIMISGKNDGINDQWKMLATRRQLQIRSDDDNNTHKYDFVFIAQKEWKQAKCFCFKMFMLYARKIKNRHTMNKVMRFLREKKNHKKCAKAHILIYVLRNSTSCMLFAK